MSDVLLLKKVKKKMGRRKKEDVERLTRQFNLESDAQFKLNEKGKIWEKIK